MLCSGSLSSLRESGILQCFFFSAPRVTHLCFQAFNILARLDFFFARSRGSASPLPHTCRTPTLLHIARSRLFKCSVWRYQPVVCMISVLNWAVLSLSGRGPRLFTTPVSSLLSGLPGHSSALGWGEQSVCFERDHQVIFNFLHRLITLLFDWDTWIMELFTLQHLTSIRLHPPSPPSPSWAVSHVARR